MIGRRAILPGWIALAVVLVGLACSSKSVRRDDNPTNPLVAAHCLSCHRLPELRSLTDSDWDEVMKDHRSRLKLSDSTYLEIRSYLLRSN